MQVLNIFHVLIAIAMMIFILIQKGAGATAGAAFGSGASGTVFGSRGAGNFLSRSTWVMGAAFCLISLTMAVIASQTSVAPETDLGVIGNTQVSTETKEAVDGPVVAPVKQTSDLPAVDEALDALNQAANQTQPEQAQTGQPQASGDMPSVEAATEGSVEATDQATDEPDTAQPEAGGENGS